MVWSPVVSRHLSSSIMVSLAFDHIHSCRSSEKLSLKKPLHQFCRVWTIVFTSNRNRWNSSRPCSRFFAFVHNVVYLKVWDCPGLKPFVLTPTYVREPYPIKWNWLSAALTEWKPVTVNIHRDWHPVICKWPLEFSMRISSCWVCPGLVFFRDWAYKQWHSVKFFNLLTSVQEGK